MPMKQANQAILKSVAAFTIWGLFPLYYALLSDISSFIVVIARIISAFVLMLFVIALLGKQKLFLDLFKDKRKWQRVLLAGILIGVNWFIFIYAVAIDEVLETSLGYYISPLLSIFLGIFFLKEEVNQKQKIAIALLVLAILYKIYVFAGLPWISLSLALSFSLYGLVKKNLQWDTLASFSLEMFFLLPLGLMGIFIITLTGNHEMLTEIFAPMDKSGDKDGGGDALKNILLLAGTGITSAIPLLLFSSSVKKINLFVVGLLNFITPSISFLLGLFYFKEKFILADFITFSLIWLALAIINFDRLMRRNA